MYLLNVMNEVLFMKTKRKYHYVEMPLSEFLDFYPEGINLFPPDLRPMFLSDPEDLVRFSEDGRFEVGYKSDNWSIS